MEQEQLAVWSTSFVNTLNDSCFLYIKEGGHKDEEGKTVPRDLRMFPYKDSSGKIDEAHLRNALARIPQSNLSESVKKSLMEKAQRLAKGVLKKYSEENMSIEYLQMDNIPVEAGKVITSIEKLDEAVPEADELQEQLTVIKEVRNELAKAYSDIKSVNGLNEQLKKDVSVLQEQLKEVEMLRNELNTYKMKEIEAEKLAYTGRLAKLSESFKYLGQVKTIEELSKLDKKTVDELEKVTQLAISTKASEKLDSVTMPTQAIQVQPKVEKMKQAETLKKTNFAESICGVLTAQQEKSGKRVISL
jgi:hypothetical protein